MPTGFIGNQNAVRQYSEYFSGNDVTLAFTMAQFGYNLNSAVSLRVYIAGVAQPPSSFAISGKILTFFTAPPTGTLNIEVVHYLPYINEMNPLQRVEFVDSMTSLNVVTLAGTSEVFALSNTSALNATSAYIQSLDAVNFRGAIEAKNYLTMNAAIAAAITNANTLIVTSNMLLQVTSTVPSTVHLVFTSNGRVTLQTGTNLWVQGPLTAPPTTRLFIGSGTANGFAAVPEVYTEWWGAVRNGSTDDTVAFNNTMIAVANTTTIKLLSGVYILNVANYTISNSTIRLSGQGESSIVRLPNTGAYLSKLFLFTGTNIIASFDHITFDQQFRNQLANSDNQGIHFQAKGTSTNSAGLIVENCTFRGGCLADINISGGDALSNTITFAIIRGNKFLDGQEGTSVTHDPRAVNFGTPCDFIVSGNYFDLGRDAIANGRAGIVSSDGWGTSPNTAPVHTPRGVITGNYLHRMGRDEAGSTLGAIDPYNYGVDLLIADNVITKCYGRGIQTKGDARRMIISNNLVDGLVRGDGGLLAINSSPDFTAGGTILIEGNVLANNPTAFGYGLVCTGVGVEEGSGVTFQSRATTVSILNNIIKDVNGTALDTSFHTDIMIHNNKISNSAYGIVTENVQRTISIHNNNVSNTNGYAIYADSTSPNAVVTIVGNHVQDVYFASNRGISVHSGKTVTVNDNTIQNTAGIGITVSSIRNATLVVGNQVERTGSHGIWCAESVVVNINDNSVSNTVAIGIYTQGGIYAATASHGIRGNRVQHITDEGIRSDSVAQVLMQGNSLSNCGTLTASAGLYCGVAGQFVSYIGNQIQHCGSAGMTVATANLNARIIVQGNQTDNTVGYGVLVNQANVIVCIQGNQVANVSGTSRGIYVGANVAGQITGNWVDPLTVTTPLFEAAGGSGDGYHSIGLNSWNATQGYGTAAPTIGIWKKNDIIWNTNAAASGNIGFVCTVAGSPGTWKNFGPIGA